MYVSRASNDFWTSDFVDLVCDVLAKGKSRRLALLYLNSFMILIFSSWVKVHRALCSSVLSILSQIFIVHCCLEDLASSNVEGFDIVSHLLNLRICGIIVLIILNYPVLLSI